MSMVRRASIARDWFLRDRDLVGAPVGREVACRRGNAACAPIACGIALAVEPCRNDPISRRSPFIAKELNKKIHHASQNLEIGKM
jgi:hypothetical protein